MQGPSQLSSSVVTVRAVTRRLSPFRKAPVPLPVIALITETGRGLQVINIDEIHPLAFQLPPHPIPRTDWPAWLIPVSQHDTFCMRRHYLRSQQRQLRIVE